MKHIASNGITTLAAVSEDSEFPIERTLDSHPRRPYKAVDGVNSTVITFDISTGISDIMFAGTNATSIVVEASDPGLVSWGDSDSWGANDGESSVSDSVTFDSDTDVTFDTDTVTIKVSGSTPDTWANATNTITGNVLQRSDSNAVWLEFSETVTIPVEVTIDISSAVGTTLEVGIIRTNISDTYSDEGSSVNPNYGVNESREDYSIKAVYSNGARYYKKGDIVRSFSMDIEMTRENFFLLMANFDAIGEEPTAWKLTDIDDNNWVVFGLMNGPPVGSHDTPDGVMTALKILEVI